MKIIISFLPWAVFWILSGRVSIEITSAVSLVFALIINIYDLKTNFVKILNIGTLLFFVIITIFAFSQNNSWIEAYSAPISNAFLFLISLFTIVIRKPFTLQYAHQQVDRSIWHSPKFYATNLIISWVWCVSFAISGLIWYLSLNHSITIGIVAQIVIYIIAIMFSNWYPKHVRAKIEE